jgi:hypothetical protein
MASRFYNSSHPNNLHLAKTNMSKKGFADHDSNAPLVMRARPNEPACSGEMRISIFGLAIVGMIGVAATAWLLTTASTC